MKVFIAISVLVFAVVIYQTNGLCNTCSLSGVACVANNQYKYCDDGVPIEPVITCPPNMICSTETTTCTRNASVAPSCARCETCDKNKIFACTKYNAFSLCSGNTDYDHTLEYICPQNLVCNIDSPRICVSEASGFGGTCPLASAGTSTPSVPATTAAPNAETEPNEFCASKGFSGNYEIPTDQTCRNFINCKNSNGTWIGSLWICPKDHYFNETINSCDTVPPARCST